MRVLLIAALSLALDARAGEPAEAPGTEPPLDAFAIAGQSQQNGNSTMDQDDPTWRVTSPTALGLFSRAFHNGVVEGETVTQWVDANDWPCRDDQCWGTECSGTNRTAAGHPDPINGADGDGSCICNCGVINATAYNVEGGSPWPTMAKRWMEAYGREIDFVPVAQGGTCLVSSAGRVGEPLWTPFVNCAPGPDWVFATPGDLHCELERAIVNADVGSTLRAVLWAQGECDAGYNVSKQDYKAALVAMADDLWAEFGVPMIVEPLSVKSAITAPNAVCQPATAPFLAIRAAQLEAIAEHPHIYLGPELDFIEYENDCTHVRDKVELGLRWADAIAATGLVEGVQPIECDDGLDNDGDGLVDFPNDPGCHTAMSTLEAPACDDDVDNDGDGNVDWDGGPHHGTADSWCVDNPWRTSEVGFNCGAGSELAFVMPLVVLATQRRRSARRHEVVSAGDSA